VELLLAADMKSSPDHRLSDAAMDATVATLRRLQGVAAEHQAAQLTGVATAVFRLAVNANELLQRIEAELGLRLRVLSQVCGIHKHPIQSAKCVEIRCVTYFSFFRRGRG